MSSCVQHAYGLTLTGLPPVSELSPGPSPEPGAVHLRMDPDTPPPALRPLDEEAGVRRLADGRVLQLDRAAGTATFFGPPLSSDLIAHPYLSPVATAFARWSGREAFHAGAVLVDGLAYAVLGPRTAGKSTMMAALAADGLTVLSDDILVTDGRLAHAGPRCVDLREVPPIDGLEVRLARRGTRHRLYLTDRPDPAPLAGWVFLEWGPQIVMHRITGPDLLRDLIARRAWRRLPSDPTRLLGLAALPAWTLTRPRDWDHLPATLLTLKDAVRVEQQARSAGPVTS